MKFNQDWFSQNIPTFEKLKLLTPIRTVLEVGVHEGLSTCWMLDKFLPSNALMTCIDPLPDETYRLFIDNVQEVKKANQTVTFYQQTSDKVLPYLLTQATRYDFIYVDGSHQAPDVLFDTVNCFHLLRAGGIMLMDDYGGKDTVKPAVDAFLYCFAGKYELVEQGYQLGIQKTSV